jgi:hypothetical protein
LLAQFLVPCAGLLDKSRTCALELEFTDKARLTEFF